jgi:hypothetical protein
MYYHSRDLKHVICGKVYPPPLESIDKDILEAYKWLGKYGCGYSPQIWLSRSHHSITGYKNCYKRKKSFFCKRISKKPQILFGFENIIGFPVDYEIWEYFFMILIGCKDAIKNGSSEIIKDLMEWEKYNKAENFLDDKDKVIALWMKYKNLQDLLKYGLFVEKDQIVVPSLNLKAAKIIYCRDEHQVKQLRQMGFIKDRIKILNSKMILSQ